MRSGKDSDKQSFLESSLDFDASHDRISFARAAVSPVLFSISDTSSPVVFMSVTAVGSVFLLFCSCCADSCVLMSLLMLPLQVLCFCVSITVVVSMISVNLGHLPVVPLWLTVRVQSGVVVNAPKTLNFGRLLTLLLANKQS